MLVWRIYARRPARVLKGWPAAWRASPECATLVSVRQRLTEAELHERLSGITAALVRDLRPERVLLFGSFARGDHNRASDLDLVIIAETALPFCERIGHALEACYRHSGGMAVEALVYTPEEWRRMVESGSSFATHVLREGRVLYDRSEPQRSRALAATSRA